MEIEVLKASRLNGESVTPGKTVNVEASLAEAWVRSGRAKIAGKKGPGRPPREVKRKVPIETAEKKPSERTVTREKEKTKNEPKADNSPDAGAGDTGGGEEAPPDRVE
jgi:hypothetical protein